MPLKINEYTGQFQSALRPEPPRVGSHVYLLNPDYGQSDAREWDDFKRLLNANRLTLEYLRSTPRKWDVYSVACSEEEA